MFASNSINGSHSVPEQKQKHIIIVGAGITGLLLAQSLRKYATASNSAPTFEIFERDPTPTFRGAGWGLTIHWSLDQFVDLLPKHLLDRLPETFVDPEAVERGETGNFLLYDLQTGEEKYRVPPSKRIRVSRERLRILLMEGLEIKVFLLSNRRLHNSKSMNSGPSKLIQSQRMMRIRQSQPTLRTLPLQQALSLSALMDPAHKSESTCVPLLQIISLFQSVF